MNMVTRYVFLGLTGLALLVSSAHGQNNKDLLKSSPALMSALSEVVIKPSWSTVRIKCDGKDVALGAIVKPDGWIITKASELKSSPVCVIKGSDKDLPAKVVGVNAAYDLAMLKVDASGLPAVEWRNSSDVEVGSWLVTVGQGKEPIAVGVLGVSSREMSNDDSWRYKFTPNPNSGFLGVRPETKGKQVVLFDIKPTSPAGKAGVVDGDILQSIDDEEVYSATAMLAILAKTKPDQELSLSLIRGGKPVELRVKLGKRPFEPGGGRADFQNSMGSKLSDKRIGFPTILQHDAVVAPTDCGGPVVDLEGRTVAINIARGGRTETFAIPSEVVQSLIPDFISGKWAVKVKSAAALRLKAAFDTRWKAERDLRTYKAQADDQLKKVKDAEKALKDAEDAVRKAQAAEKELKTSKVQAEERMQKVKEAEKVLKDAEDAVKKAQAEVEAERKKDVPKNDEPKKDDSKRDM